MEKNYTFEKRDLNSARITFWVYVVCIPIIIFLYLLPIIRTKQFVLSPFSLIYPVLTVFLIYQAYKSVRVLLSVKKSHCTVTEDTVSGVSIPNPFKREIPFTIARKEILSVAKSNITVGTMRPYNTLVINTENSKYTLFAIEKLEELKQELQQ